MDQRRKETSLCDYLVDYMVGEGTEVERKRYERHLAECPSCRAEAIGWEEAWDRLSHDMEELEPPPELKQQILNSLNAEPEAGKEYAIGAASKPNELAAARPARSGMRRFGLWGAAAVVLAFAFSAGWWSQDAFRGSRQEPIAALPASDRIESIFHLTADRASGEFAEYPQAYGVACVVSSAPDQAKQLVVYLFGVPETEGSQAYQVWLWDDGTRRSAGSMKVEASGIGILTLSLGDDTAPIQSIGITLEPNGSSAAPQGPKVFGSSPDDPAWEA